MSTTNAVAKVMEYKKKNEQHYSSLIHELNMENKKAIEAIESNELNRFKSHFENSRALTKRLGELAGVGIENDSQSELIEQTKKNGAFVAKLPGAGGGDSIIAICLGKSNAKNVQAFWKRQGLNVLDVNITNDGVKVR